MTKKKTLRIILALLTFLSVTTYGQEKKEQTKKDTIRQWEVGLDLLWLINKNQVPATSIFGRYNFIDKKGNHKALRLRLGILSNSFDSTQVYSAYSVNIKTFAPLIRPGFEWQVEAKNRLTFFYGVDLSVSHLNKVDRQILLISNPTLFEYRDKNWTFGIHGLVGFKYRLSESVYLSTETTLNVITQWNHRDILSGADPNIPGTGGLGETNTQKTNVSFIPITVINISFKF